mmetsp:Transcript_10148/g.31996  ORF Transcript_10148/g.31996 Transcript_10148/m.31996 type:complete len:291 (-) Transcript_10148:246-1118(-)
MELSHWPRGPILGRQGRLPTNHCWKSSTTGLSSSMSDAAKSSNVVAGRQVSGVESPAMLISTSIVGDPSPDCTGNCIPTAGGVCDPSFSCESAMPILDDSACLGSLEGMGTCRDCTGGSSTSASASGEFVGLVVVGVPVETVVGPAPVGNGIMSVGKRHLSSRLGEHLASSQDTPPSAPAVKHPPWSASRLRPVPSASRVTACTAFTRSSTVFPSPATDEKFSFTHERRWALSFVAWAPRPLATCTSSSLWAYRSPSRPSPPARRPSASAQSRRLAWNKLADGAELSPTA